MAEPISETEKSRPDNLAQGARGGAIAFILKISSTVLGFLNQVILARILGAGGLGEVILAITVVRISIQIAKFGMEETMTKFIPLYIDRKDDAKLKGTILFAIKFCLLFSVIFMLFVLMFSKFIALNIFHSEGLLKLMPVVIIAIPAWVIRDIIGGILRGHKDAFRALIPESLIAPFFKIVVFLLLTLKGIAPFYAIIAFVTGEILSVIVSFSYLQKILRPLKAVRGQCDKKKIMEVAYTIIFTGMSVLLYTQADVWILGMFKPTEIVGIYGIATKLVLLVYFPMMAFAAVIPSLISSIHASGDLTELKKVVSESTRWIMSMAMPIILILLIEGKYILKYFYGPEFEAGYTVLVILTLGQMIKAGAGLIGVILQMTGEHKVYMKVNIVLGILNIILNILLVPRYGMTGAAAATSFCLVMVDLICIYIIHKRLSILTLAKGIKFDIVFITVITAVYFLFSYFEIQIGHHLLLLVALTVYLWKSMSNNDIPWKLLMGSINKGR
ncbi:MAG: flippase [Nitrospiraceae bacterium]|nr:MAG: flippase [Nitrospiraceae bacterium]